MFLELLQPLGNIHLYSNQTLLVSSSSLRPGQLSCLSVAGYWLQIYTRKMIPEYIMNQSKPYNAMLVHALWCYKLLFLVDKRT